MTDRLREAAQAALDDLEARCGSYADERGPDGSITKLRAALAEQDAEQKPAAWIREDTAITTDAYQASCWRDAHTVTPLYAHPPRRDWQSLDGKELESCFRAASSREWGADYKWVLYRAIEQKLKEKNHE